MNGAPLHIRPARPRDAATLGRLMITGLNSRLADLGPWFVTFLHRHMAVSKHCICSVAERDGRIVGYAATFTSTRRFYREFIVRKGLPAAAIVLPWMLRPRNLRTAAGGLSYSGRAPTDDPQAELVSLVVAPEAHRTGVGNALFTRMLDDLRDRGIGALKITTDSSNKAADAFYRRFACELVRTQRLYHDTLINVYVRRVA